MHDSSKHKTQAQIRDFISIRSTPVRIRADSIGFNRSDNQPFSLPLRRDQTLREILSPAHHKQSEPGICLPCIRIWKRLEPGVCRFPTSLLLLSIFSRASRPFGALQSFRPDFFSMLQDQASCAVATSKSPEFEVLTATIGLLLINGPRSIFEADCFSMSTSKRCGVLSPGLANSIA